MQEIKIQIPRLDTPSILFSYHTIIPIFYKYDVHKNRQIGECRILLENGKHNGEIKILDDVDLNCKFLLSFSLVEELRYNITELSLVMPDEDIRDLPSLNDYKL